MTAPKSLDVVGIGNAIVDVLVQTDDRFLDDHGLTLRVAIVVQGFL